jgi:uncharacterized phiE125 gp8 family phage protein
VSSFELITPPEKEPISLSEARTFIRYPDRDEDGVILGLMETARKLFESYTQRALVTSTWKLHLPRFPVGGIPIRKLPVKEIESVTYFDDNDASQTWAESNYQTDLLGIPPTLWPGYGISYPSTRSGKLNAVSIQFVAGDEVEDVDRRDKSAILILTKHLFDNRDLVGNVQLHETPFAFRALVDSRKWTVYPAGVV